MTVAQKIMDEPISDIHKLIKMEEHWYTTADWLDKNQKITSRTDDELEVLCKEILDDIIELNNRIREEGD